MPGLTNRRAGHYGTNVRVTVCATQGGRKYMEDRVHIHAERTAGGELDFLFFGCYDGHGGAQASEFTKQHLMRNVVEREELFRSQRDDDVLEAIRLGFLDTHYDMLKVVGGWPRTASGYQSTAGTTASIAFVMRGKLYTGHVGDSAIVLGRRTNDETDILAERLTIDHKPDAPEELSRIERHGGQVLNKAGVMRVVWRRTIRGHEGPVRRSTQTECIPFLAVARSLGDLWSYNEATEEYVVSPEPDVAVHTLSAQDCCIVLASDGLWNVIRDQYSISIVDAHEWRELDEKQIEPPHLNRSIHPNHSRWLVRHALRSWGYMRADNITAITVIFDPPHSCLDEEAGCVVAADVDSERLDEVLSDSPTAMLRITDDCTQQLRTAPVELVYNGAMDPTPQPANGSSFHASQRVCTGFRGPGFTQHTAAAAAQQQRQLSALMSSANSNRSTAAAAVKRSTPPRQPPPAIVAARRRSSIADIPFSLSDSADDDLSEVEPTPPAPAPTTTTATNDHKVDGCGTEQVVDDDDDEDDYSDCPPTDVPLEEYCCPRHALKCYRPQPTEKSKAVNKSAGHKPFLCDKHGQGSAKAEKLNNETSPCTGNADEDACRRQDMTTESDSIVEDDSSSRQTETPPPPDPKPSGTPLPSPSVNMVSTPELPPTAAADCRRQAVTSARRARRIAGSTPGVRYNLRRASKQSNISQVGVVIDTPCTYGPAAGSLPRSAPPKQHYLRSVVHNTSSPTACTKPRHTTTTVRLRRDSHKEFAENIESLLDQQMSLSAECVGRRSGGKRSSSERRRQQQQQRRPASSCDTARTRTAGDQAVAGDDEASCDCSDCVRIGPGYNSVFGRLNLHSTACTRLSSVCRQGSRVELSAEANGSRLVTRHHSYSLLTSAHFAAARSPRGRAVTKRKLFDGSSGEASSTGAPTAKRSRLWSLFNFFGTANDHATKKNK